MKGAPPPPTTAKMTPEHVAKQIEANRQALQAQYEEEYQQAIVAIKTSLNHTEGPDIKETMADEIREWILEVR